MGGFRRFGGGFRGNRFRSKDKNYVIVESNIFIVLGYDQNTTASQQVYENNEKGVTLTRFNLEGTMYPIEYYNASVESLDLRIPPIYANIAEASSDRYTPRPLNIPLTPQWNICDLRVVVVRDGYETIGIHTTLPNVQAYRPELNVVIGARGQTCLYLNRFEGISITRDYSFKFNRKLGRKLKEGDKIVASFARGPAIVETTLPVDTGTSLQLMVGFPVSATSTAGLHAGSEQILGQAVTRTTPTEDFQRLAQLDAFSIYESIAQRIQTAMPGARYTQLQANGVQAVLYFMEQS